jgi:tetratricopeptide (TPR) repeat protein/pimeloyl-ACP methyl ester carboxylesterase
METQPIADIAKYSIAKFQMIFRCTWDVPFLGVILSLVALFNSIFPLISFASPNTQLDNFIQWGSKQIIPAPKMKGPVVIFIPGILGSKLEQDGKVLWGETAFINFDANRGAIKCTSENKWCEDSKVKAKPLLKFEIDFLGKIPFTSEDVYGNLSNRLNLAQGEFAVKPVVEYFYYDWRQSIENTANKLDEKINELQTAGVLNGNQLVIVAHSMGGLVAWKWKDKIYKERLARGDLKFRVTSMILLGSPLKGSCEMLRLMLRGYVPIPSESKYDQLYSHLFSDFRDEALTFPSIYQLLPPSPSDGNISESCLQVDTTDGLIAQNLDSDSSLINLNIASGNEQRNEIIRTHVKGASEFRKSLYPSSREPLNEFPLNDRIYYIYSKSKETITDIEKPLVNNYKYNAKRLGDGRVLMSSATNGNPNGRNAFPAGDYSHGNLFLSVSAFDIIKKEVMLAIAEEQAKKYAIEINKKKDIKQIYINDKMKPVLQNADVGAVLIQAYDEGEKAIEELKNSVQQNDLNINSQNLKKETAYAYAVKHDKIATRTAYLELSIKRPQGADANKDVAIDAYSLNRIGNNLIEKKQYSRAITSLLSATDKIEEVEKTGQGSVFGTKKDWATLQQSVFNNLGRSYKETGNYEKAIEAYIKADTLGSPKAKKNLADTYVAHGRYLFENYPQSEAAGDNIQKAKKVAKMAYS